MLANSIMNLGMVEQDRGQLDTARSELEAALDLFERDGRRLQFPLLAELDDCHGNRFDVGFYWRQEWGFLAYSPKHLLTDEAGRYQFLPLRWRLALV
jgi:hypothetical protein